MAEPIDDVEYDARVSADRYRAPALDRGLDILEILSNQARGLTRAEIVKEMGLSASQIYRMLERLVARRYVARIEGDRYALTMKLFLVGTRLPPIRRLAAQAQPLMDAFARAVHQSCHLVVPEGGMGIVIAQGSPGGHWEFRARVGGQLDLFTTGSGKALLAFQRPERLETVLGLWGVGDAASKLAKVGPSLPSVREQGYRLEPSGQLVGVVDISVPIFGPQGDAVAALTCAYIEHPDETETGGQSRALEKLISVGAELSHR